MGMEVVMLKGEGPHFPKPLSNPSEVDALVGPDKALPELTYVFNAINLTRRLLKGKVPLIGFSGGPWTLMAYMIEGGGSKLFSKAKKWLFAYPEASHKLLRKLTDVIIVYLQKQVDAGAQLLQVFESWAGELGPATFQEFLLPYLNDIATQVKAKHPTIPLIVFPKGANHYTMDSLKESGYDVIGCDWTIDPKEARAKTQRGEGKSPKVLQGNLDPCALYGSEETIKREVREMLQGFGTQGLIANLGHGLHPSHNPAHVGVFIDAVHSISDEMNAK
eukprot:TRINITY_DN2974_c0_g1_i1.p1 TRINITY_DN2974_c0_g1~~TRINITY_DN2974_c0_g1_i1.p1  ORF type:complete len:276 (-),score=46.68 TRINITY_DN2974_c0_g1_i1:46-873(-)